MNLWNQNTDHINSNRLKELYISLETKFRLLKLKNADTLLKDNPVVADIEQALQLEQSFANAYHLKLLMLPLFDNQELTDEIMQLNLKEETSTQIIAGYCSGNEIDKLDKANKQGLLKVLIEKDEYDRYNTCERNYFKWVFQRRASLALIFCFVLYFPEINPLVAAVKTNSMIYYVGTSIVGGMLGACFSILGNLEKQAANSSLASLKSISNWSSIIARIFTGGTGSLIMYYLIYSGMLGGNFFPKMPEPVDGIIMLSSTDKYKLMIWLFLAGFSEKLISRVLQEAEKKAKA